jgi:hypothetical protein
MRTLYEVWIDPNESEAKQSQKGRQHIRLQLLVEKHLTRVAKSLPTFAVLDWGGGWSAWAMAAQALGYEAYMLDISTTRTDHSLQNGIIPITSTESIQGVCIGFINASQVLEHVSYPSGLLQHLANTLTPGGGLSISVPNAEEDRDPDHFVRKGPYHPLEHINGFTRKSLRRLIKNVGLDIERGGTVAIPGGRLSLLRAMIVNIRERIVPETWLPLSTNTALAIKKQLPD